MAWTGSPADKRAWARKKQAERAAVGGHQALPGYTVPPHKHRCDVGDHENVLHAGTPLLGSRCKVCGRQWRYSPGPTGWPLVEIIPLTTKCPPASERTAVASSQPNVPSGKRNELPPDHLVGAQRGQWWLLWAERRQERRRRMLEKLPPEVAGRLAIDEAA